MSTPLKMNREQLADFLTREFPQYSAELLEVEASHSRLRLPVNDEHLRPGGTISGPTMMALADVALYVAILSKIGPVALAVTTDFTCHFLNKPQAGKALLAQATLLKQGKRLVIGEVEIFSEGSDSPVAHVVASYSVPPRSE